MRCPSSLVGLLVGALVCVGAPGWAQPVPVEVPTAGWSTAPTALKALVFQPTGAGVHPAVVMLHGCGGANGKDGQLNARHRMWGEYLAAQGYVALMLDSFSARGVRELCTVLHSARILKEADRVGDAYAALAYLRQQPHVDASRIALLGWSHGAGVTLDAIAQPKPSVGGFHAAVAFYPGCSARSQRAQRFHPYAPVLLLIGEVDDWTPAAPCKKLVSAVAERGEPMQIVTYPDTFHDFDNPALKGQHLRTDVPNGAHPGSGVTTAPNAVAREDAKRRVTAFFAQHFQ